MAWFWAFELANNRGGGMKTVFQESTLWLKTGDSDQKVADFIQEQTTDFSNLLYWLEPAVQLNSDGSSGRLKNFNPFSTTSLPETLPKLEAAYLFGRYHDLPVGLQVIAAENGCRWCRFQTWQGNDYEKKIVQERDSYSALTRRDFERFFGNSNKSDWVDTVKNRKLQVTEYWTDEGLLTWWLSKEQSNGNR